MNQEPTIVLIYMLEIKGRGSKGGVEFLYSLLSKRHFILYAWTKAKLLWCLERNGTFYFIACHRFDPPSCSHVITISQTC